MRQHPPSSSSSSSSSTPIHPSIHPSILLTVSPPPLALACARRVRCGVGAVSCGAGYLSVLVQTLYHLPLFHQLRLEGSVSGSNGDRIARSVRQVFADLDDDSRSLGVSTVPLTDALDGIAPAPETQQQDAEEILLKLLAKLRESNADLESKTDALFQGKIQSYLQCVSVPYATDRTETFLDVSLDVTGCRHLTDSFVKYTRVELLSGSNKYNAPGHGPVDARKGIRFLAFPPVLQLHLKRFGHAGGFGQGQKVNDRLEFDANLDLTPFLDPQRTAIDQADPPHYLLHSVIVHRGESAHTGHYICFVRPFFQDGLYTDSSWYKFDDDDEINPVGAAEAITANYGGLGDGGVGGSDGPPANAYMLVYVRESVVAAMQRCARLAHPRSPSTAQAADSSHRSSSPPSSSAPSSSSSAHAHPTMAHIIQPQPTAVAAASHSHAPTMASVIASAPGKRKRTRGSARKGLHGVSSKRPRRRRQQLPVTASTSASASSASSTSTSASTPALSSTSASPSPSPSAASAKDSTGTPEVTVNSEEAVVAASLASLFDLREPSAAEIRRLLRSMVVLMPCDTIAYAVELRRRAIVARNIIRYAAELVAIINERANHLMTLYIMDLVEHNLPVPDLLSQQNQTMWNWAHSLVTTLGGKVKPHALEKSAATVAAAIACLLCSALISMLLCYLQWKVRRVGRCCALSRCC